jgi:hypothetical protein
MPHAGAEEYHSQYSAEADKLLESLKGRIDRTKPPGGHFFGLDELKELYDVFEHAVLVCKAAAGDKPSIEMLNFNKTDGLEIGMNHWGAMLLAESLSDTIAKEGGTNYVELELNGHDKGPILVRIQFKDKKTPAMIAAERKAFIEDLELVLQDKNQEIEDLNTEVEGLLIALGEKDV